MSIKKLIPLSVGGKGKGLNKIIYFLVGTFLVTIFFLFSNFEHSNAFQKYDGHSNQSNYDEYPKDKNKEDVIFQTSTINAALLGQYDGHTLFKDLKQYGNFGLGGPEGFDGEMIGLDNDFYQIRSNGVAYPIDNSSKTSFATVKFFKPDKVFTLNNEVRNFEDLQKVLDDSIPTKNLMYAVELQGKFEYLKVRSIPKPSKPYPPLSELVKQQSISELYDVEGTIVGFRFPNYMSNLNVSPYHFHFITKDKKAGGHLFDCRTTDVEVAIDYSSEFRMSLPSTDEFYSADLLNVEGGNNVFRGNN